MQQKDFDRDRIGGLAALAVLAAALLCTVWLILRLHRWYAQFEPWEALLTLVLALVILRLVMLRRSKRQRKTLRVVLLSLLCLPILISAIFGLNESFCATVENYGVRLPAGGRVVRSCGYTVGFDRTQISELDYGGSVPDTGIPWEERNPEADAILEQIIADLRTVDGMKPLENAELLTELEAGREALLHRVLCSDSQRLCLLLYDRVAQVLYLCEAKW